MISLVARMPELCWKLHGYKVGQEVDPEHLAESMLPVVEDADSEGDRFVPVEFIPVFFETLAAVSSTSPTTQVPVYLAVAEGLYTVAQNPTLRDGLAAQLPFVASRAARGIVPCLDMYWKPMDATAVMQFASAVLQEVESTQELHRRELPQLVARASRSVVEVVPGDTDPGDLRALQSEFTNCVLAHADAYLTGPEFDDAVRVQVASEYTRGMRAAEPLGVFHLFAGAAQGACSLVKLEVGLYRTTEGKLRIGVPRRVMRFAIGPRAETVVREEDFLKVMERRYKQEKKARRDNAMQGQDAPVSHAPSRAILRRVFRCLRPASRPQSFDATPVILRGCVENELSMHLSVMDLGALLPVVACCNTLSVGAKNMDVSFFLHQYQRVVESVVGQARARDDALRAAGSAPLWPDTSSRDEELNALEDAYALDAHVREHALAQDHTKLRVDMSTVEGAHQRAVHTHMRSMGTVTAAVSLGNVLISEFTAAVRKRIEGDSDARRAALCALEQVTHMQKAVCSR